MSSTANREYTTQKTFNASIEKVWEAWTNPEIVKAWWGPEGFTNTIQKFDLKPGGNWHFVMHGPNPNGKGTTDFPNHIVFLEISKPHKLVFDHVSGPHFVATVEFEKENDKTKINWHTVFKTVAEWEAVKGFAIEGNRQTLNRLAAILEKG